MTRYEIIGPSGMAICEPRVFSNLSCAFIWAHNEIQKLDKSRVVQQCNSNAFDSINAYVFVAVAKDNQLDCINYLLKAVSNEFKYELVYYADKRIGIGYRVYGPVFMKSQLDAINWAKSVLGSEWEFDEEKNMFFCIENFGTDKPDQLYLNKIDRKMKIGVMSNYNTCKVFNPLEKIVFDASEEAYAVADFLNTLIIAYPGMVSIKDTDFLTVIPELGDSLIDGGAVV